MEELVGVHCPALCGEALFDVSVHVVAGLMLVLFGNAGQTWDLRIHLFDCQNLFRVFDFVCGDIFVDGKPCIPC